MAAAMYSVSMGEPSSLACQADRSPWTTTAYNYARGAGAVKRAGIRSRDRFAPSCYTPGMSLRWKYVADPDAYVALTLAREAGDIPRETIAAHAWYVAELPLSSIKVDEAMVRRHDLDEAHSARRDRFARTIARGDELLPLIVLGGESRLVDGYARYRACKMLGIERVRVLRQEHD